MGHILKREKSRISSSSPDFFFLGSIFHIFRLPTYQEEGFKPLAVLGIKMKFLQFRKIPTSQLLLLSPLVTKIGIFQQTFLLSAFFRILTATENLCHNFNFIHCHCEILTTTFYYLTMSCFIFGHFSSLFGLFKTIQKGFKNRVKWWNVNCTCDQIVGFQPAKAK